MQKNHTGTEPKAVAGDHNEDYDDNNGDSDNDDEQRKNLATN